jgi:hypothetical protein
LLGRQVRQWPGVVVSLVFAAERHGLAVVAMLQRRTTVSEWGVAKAEGGVGL